MEITVEMEGLVVDLTDPLELSTFEFALAEAAREIAGPGNQGAYGQILVWQDRIARFKREQREAESNG